MSVPAFLKSIGCIASAIISPPSNNSITGASGGANTIDTTGATLFVAILRCNGGSGNPPDISDSEGNIWSLGSISTGIGSCLMRLAWVFNPTTSTTHSFDCPAPATEGSAEVFAFGGSGTWSKISEVLASSETSGTSVVTGSVTALLDDVVIAGIGSNGSESSGTINSGFSGGISGDPTDTALPQLLSSSPEVGMSGFLISSGGSVAATFSTSVSNGDWKWAISNFRLSATPPPTSVPSVCIMT